MGAWVSKLLSRIGLICSDSQRWSAEKTLVLETKDEDLAPSDPNIPVAIAWDNCDTDATAKFESATHNGQIAAIVNVLNVQPGESMRLSESSSWTLVMDITFDAYLGSANAN